MHHYLAIGIIQLALTSSEISLPLDNGNTAHFFKRRYGYNDLEDTINAIKSQCGKLCDLNGTSYTHMDNVGDFFYQPIKKPTCSRLSMVTDNGANVMPKILNGWSNETMFDFSNFYLNYIDGN